MGRQKLQLERCAKKFYLFELYQFKASDVFIDTGMKNWRINSINSSCYIEYSEQRKNRISPLLEFLLFNGFLTYTDQDKKIPRLQQTNV